MEKKLYKSPLTEVMKVGTDVMQHLNPPSQTAFPGGPAGVPRRWKEPVHLTPVF